MKKFLKNFLLLFSDVLPYFGKILKQYGPMVHMNVLGHSYVLLNDPEDIKVFTRSLLIIIYTNRF